VLARERAHLVPEAVVDHGTRGRDQAEVAHLCSPGELLVLADEYLLVESAQVLEYIGPHARVRTTRVLEKTILTQGSLARCEHVPSS